MLIKNGNLHIGDTRILPETDIRIAGSKIVEIGAHLPMEGEQIIDAAGKEVFPGFIDPFCAIGCMGIPTRYMDNNEVSDPLMPEMNLKYSVDPDELSNQEFYRSGITTVGMAPTNANICGGQVAVVKTPPMKFADRILKENAVLKCSVTSAIKEQFGEKSTLPMTKMGIFYLLEKLFTDTKNHQDPDNEKQQVIRKVLDQKLPVCIAAEKQSEIQSALHFATEEGIQVTILDGYEFDRCLPEFLENKANLVLGNLSNLSQKTKHHMDLSKLQSLIDRGNHIAFSTTCGGYSEGREVILWNAIDVYNEGIDPEEVIRMLTDHPAHILGVEDRIGTLESGKDADILIYTGHPVTTYQAKVETCLVNGEVIYHE